LLQTAYIIDVNTLVMMQMFFQFSVRYSYDSSISFKGTIGMPDMFCSIATLAVFQLLFTYSLMSTALVYP